MEPEKRRKIIKYSIITIVVLIVSYYVGWIYHKPAYNGRVLDAETKEPIEGAVAVAIYEAFPIISGLGGGSDIEIGVQEVLTDEKGEFHIPSYTTILLPFWIRSGVKFVIYKPGYGSHPGLNVKPIEKMSQWAIEQFFYAKAVGESGTIAERGEEWVKYEVTFGVVELPKLKTWEERRNSMISADLHGEFPAKKIRGLMRLINEEHKNLGLTPYSEYEDK
jgi:hypothetical protein